MYWEKGEAVYPSPQIKRDSQPQNTLRCLMSWVRGAEVLLQMVQLVVAWAAEWPRGRGDAFLTQKHSGA